MNKNLQQEKDFLLLIESHKRVIYKVCYMYATDDELLNDLYQEIVMNLWRAYLWGIERSGFFNGREKWAKGFENQRV